MFIAVVQFNPKVGALRENCERALEKIDELASLAYPPDLVIFPAFALSGAELGGMVTHNAFAAEALDVAQSFISKASLPTLIGTVLPRPSLSRTRFVCEEEVLFAMNGMGSALGFLDTNTEADFHDYVESIHIKLSGFNLTIVLDDFIDPDTSYNDADVIISMIARPYQEANGLLTASNQVDSLRADAISNNAWVVVASLCGGEDSYIYEGASLVLGPDGSVVESAPAFEEAVFTVNLSKQQDHADEDRGRKQLVVHEFGPQSKQGELTPLELRKRDRKRIIPLLPYEANWRALTIGTRDYVVKNGFKGVVLGLSGGIDSSVAAALAVDALGARQVHGVLLPSPYSSESSRADAQALGATLGLELLEFPITTLFESFLSESEKYLHDSGSALAQENLQARLRMLVLMHLSNTYGWLLLNTGNKSEVAVGYSTLYGDTAGGIAPLGNIYKTDVYGLAHWRNSRSPVIPQSVLEKEPSAELSLNQKDTDSLPPYDTLDQILRLHIEENLGVDEILEFISSYPIKTDIDTQTILAVLEKVRKAEFKRRQEPMAFLFDGIDITEQRAWPVTNGFSDHSRDIIAPSEMMKYLSAMYQKAHQSGLNFLDN